MNTKTEIQLTEKNKRDIYEHASSSPRYIITRALALFYKAYTQLYLPDTMVLTLRDCVVEMLLSYFASVDLEGAESFLNHTYQIEARQEIVDIINQSCKGKGDSHADKFIKELDQCYFSVFGNPYEDNTESSNQTPA